MIRNVQRKADMVKFEGTMTKWPVQKANTAQQETQRTRRDELLTQIVSYHIL